MRMEREIIVYCAKQILPSINKPDVHVVCHFQQHVEILLSDKFNLSEFKWYSDFC